MIQTLHVENFRSLRRVTVELSPLTVLVGPNGSGKSNLLEILSAEHTWQESDGWRHSTRDVRATYSRDGSVEARGFGHPLGHRSAFLRPGPAAMRQPVVVRQATRLDANGSELANVVSSLGRQAGAVFAERFCRLVPVFGDVDVVPETGGRHWLRFHDRWDPSVFFTPDEVSDGTLIVAAYLAATMAVDRPDLLLVEDPEHGLHPWLIGQVVALFRELSAPTDRSRPVQIVAATHSADLLRHLRPEEVRFVDRDPADGGTLVRSAPTSSAHWDEAMALWGNVGDLWLSGTLGGVPGR